MINSVHADDEIESRRQLPKSGLRGAGVKAEARRTAGRSEAQSLDAGEHRPTLPGRRRTASSESHGLGTTDDDRHSVRTRWLRTSRAESWRTDAASRQRGCRNPANEPEGGVRNGRTRTAAGRRTHRPSRARSTRRSATLAQPKVRAIAGKVRAMSVTVRPYRRGGWEVDLRVTLPDESEHRMRLKAPLGSKSAAQRWGEERERHWYHKLTHPQLVKRTEGGSDTETVRAAFPRRPRAGQSSEAERHRGQGNDPARASGARVGSQEAGRDQERARATTEARSGGEVAEDGEQRLEPC